MFDTLIRIEVGVGDKKRTFEVFRSVIVFYSGYFAAALNGRFREAAEGVVTLPTEDPLTFEMFAHWLYTRQLFDSTVDPSDLLDFAMLAKLWVFGDALEVPLFQNRIIDIIREKFEHPAPRASCPNEPRLS